MESSSVCLSKPAFLPRTSYSRLGPTLELSFYLPCHLLKSITPLGAPAPVNSTEVQNWQRVPHPASSRPLAQTKEDRGDGGREREAGVHWVALNTVRASGPTGTLIKYLDIFIDKLLISVLISLAKTDNFIFASARGMKGRGSFQEFNWSNCSHEGFFWR